MRIARRSVKPVNYAPVLEEASSPFLSPLTVMSTAVAGTLREAALFATQMLTSSHVGGKSGSNLLLRGGICPGSLAPSVFAFPPRNTADFGDRSK